MNTQNDICPNCKTERFGEFCSSCGQQRLHRERLTFLYSIKHMLSSVVDVDGSIFQTTKTLFFQPGKLTNEYLSDVQ